MTGAWKEALGNTGVGLLVSLLFVACSRSEPPPVASEAAPSAAPVDRLAPGELVPGTEKAFSIVLPRGVRIDQALTDVVFASGSVNASDVANYIRARVQGGTVSVGAFATVFDQVKAIDDPVRSLFVRIFPGPSGQGARIEVRNVTPPAAPSLSSTAERWKQFGLDPSGKLLDPQHLH
jgi:hypothetical protein